MALHRLQAEGRVESDERGQYRLGAAAAPVQSVVAGWRELDRRTRAWNGRWIAVHAARAAPRVARGSTRRRSALRLFGFERLAPGSARAARESARGSRGRAQRAARARAAPTARSCSSSASSTPAADARARSLWDGAALVRGYRAARREIERSSARLPRCRRPRRWSSRSGSAAACSQQLVLDPLLPAPLVDERERRALLESMRAYDRLGRDAWASFLGRFGVPHRTAPADTRWAAEDFAKSA